MVSGNNVNSNVFILSGMGQVYIRRARLPSALLESMENPVTAGAKPVYLFPGGIVYSAFDANVINSGYFWSNPYPYQPVGTRPPFIHFSELYFLNKFII